MHLHCNVFHVTLITPLKNFSHSIEFYSRTFYLFCFYAAAAAAAAPMEVRRPPSAAAAAPMEVRRPPSAAGEGEK